MFINGCHWLQIKIVIVEISVIFIFFLILVAIDIRCWIVHCNAGSGKYYLIQY